MTRVVDNLDGRVVQTYSSGEGRLTPKQDPNRYYLQLRYTVSDKGETWGWLSKSFLSFEAAIDFTRRQLLPRNICDAVRVIKDNHNFLTWYYTEPAAVKFTTKDAPRSGVFEDFLKKYYPPRNDAADALAYSMHSQRAAVEECAKPCTRDTNGDGDCSRCAPPRGLPKSMFGIPVKEVDMNLGKTPFKFGPIPQYKEMGGQVLDTPRVREWFRQWMRSRFRTEYNDEIELHCAMFEAFRAAMEIRVLRAHQS
jgi:hypothetical protein